jgi:hypothetical protein
MKVQAWIKQRLAAVSLTVTPDPRLLQLDAGERGAIILAEELSADRLIVDELLGRREAEQRSLPFGARENLPGSARQKSPIILFPASWCQHSSGAQEDRFGQNWRAPSSTRRGILDVSSHFFVQQSALHAFGVDDARQNPARLRRG